MSMRTLVFIAFTILLLCWGVGAHNRLVRLRNAIANAFAQMDVHLKRRYEQVATLVEGAKQYLQLEQSTLVAVIHACNKAQTASDAMRSRPLQADAVTALASAEQSLRGELEQFFAVFEAHPALMADQAVGDLIAEITSTGNKIGFAHQAYKDAVLDYNNAQGQFPAFLVARMFSFEPSAILQLTESNEERKGLSFQH